MRLESIIALTAVILTAFAPVDVDAGAAKTGALNGKIKNVVLLVMENRSFDNVLGYWARTRPNVNGIPDKACNTLSSKGIDICSTDKQVFVNLNPKHETEFVTREIYGKDAETFSAGTTRTPTMAGFVDVMEGTWNTSDPNLLRQVMDGYNPKDIPITATLASEYAVFDRWFSSLPGPTFPNRLFLYSATSNGEIGNDKFQTLKGFPQKSIFGALDQAKVSWKNYFGIVPTSIMVRDARASTNVLTKLRPMSSFYDDARKGNLPSFSFIDPILFDMPGFQANDNHPPHNFANGEQLIKNVYEAVRQSPQWNSTLLLITYDENGGFWDHVPPPSKDIPAPDDISANSKEFRFDRLGPRVPTIAISPWVQRGRVISKPNGPTPSSEFEHSSVSGTLKNIFGLPNFLTKRDAWAGTFDFLFDEVQAARTDCPWSLPDAPSTTHVPGQEEDDDSVEEYEAFVDAFKGISFL
ncbi:hypothetical protein HDU97_010429 [Phlyctochytrium planicorne]|nr:hypothetical protein HDU97_010429 [Phlyctochytrium planicorne]